MSRSHRPRGEQGSGQGLQPGHPIPAQPPALPSGRRPEGEVAGPAPSVPGDAVAVGRLADTVHRLRHQLRRAHAEAEGRALVELASGILVERLTCSPTEAAAQLENLAAQAGLSTLELAADLVNQATRDKIADVARDFVAEAHLPAKASVGLRLRSVEAGALAAGDAQAVAQSILQHALAPLGAVAVAIWAANADQSLSLAGSAGFADGEAARWCHVPPGVPTPARRALDNRAVTSYDTLAEAALPSIGLRELGGGRIAVPAGTGGRIIGVLEICWHDTLPDQSQSVERQVQVLAELCAVALETHPLPDPGPRTSPPADPRLTELLDLTDGLNDPCLVLEPLLDSADTPADFLIRHVNPSFVDFAGRPRNLIAGARLLDAYPLAAEPGGLFDKVEHVLATGEPFRAERMRLAAVVDTVSLATQAQVSVSRQGTHVLVVWRLDEGAPKVASLLQHAQRLGRIGGFEENLLTGEIAWNETLFDLHGLAPTAQPIPLDQLAAHVHPDDAHSLGRFLRSLLHHQRPASTAFRLQRADSVPRHIRVVAEPVLDDNARVTAVRGAYQDVSAQHWTEVALAATRDQLAQSQQETAERNRLALRLQHAIMPPSHGPVDLHNLSVAVRYRPAEKDHLVGGDWYDAVALPSGQVLLCVGDVAGHGIEAATGMVALRNALRGLATTGAGPAQLLAWLNTVTHHLTDHVTATAVCGLYDPDSRQLRWARAGHLPPVLLRDGQAGALPKLDGILLGATSQARYEEGRTQLETGDTLLMYTDGLIERRDRSVQDSLEGLLQVAGNPGLLGGGSHLEDRLDHLLRYTNADTDDDTCLIGVTVR
ncbi:ANTAR domain-containing protein [Streptomyces sp. SDr-06]|uniref:SpoIIE family protein phosphatase n=1 Tax=Streptomyces sp. SDr-06 TaxID=2267702 RepID=UPI000DE90502|nr:ANTAR domain-containing protein [Streptomyces sp. SDr-06]